MDYTIDYLDDKNIVCVKMKGKLNSRISEQYSMGALKVAHRNNCTRFLFDHSRTTVEDKINRFYAAGE